jgi:hypothetical protein
MDRARRIAVSIVTSWWFLGALGWGLIVLSFPVDTQLPIYAG